MIMDILMHMIGMRWFGRDDNVMGNWLDRQVDTQIHMVTD